MTDHAKATDLLNWAPRHRPKQIVEDIAEWVRANESSLSGVIV
jgi:nucleoside-diphosphate-sugar epimerase